MENKEYRLAIDPRILELLGPSLYTNIYYVLAELIANAYDADAKNVYIIANPDDITIEDDGCGTVYQNGDIQKYLNVAGISRSTDEESRTEVLQRMKMGRKGVGKLAALSVSENVKVLTIRDGEKSGFILTRHPENGRLPAIENEEVAFEKVGGNGTAIIMTYPEYRLHKSLEVVKKNLLKIFPLVGEDFKIHVSRGQQTVVLDSVDKTYASQLCALITLGNEYNYLAPLVPNEYPSIRNALVETRDSYQEPLSLRDNSGQEHEYCLEIRGWIGTYKSTKGRKADMSDFPDNFISLYAHKKMGEFNILPRVGQNKMNEVYVVGQLFIDLFEETDLPDMALSNRQGYKTDDPRYEAVMKYVREKLLPSIIDKRTKYTEEAKKGKELKKLTELEKKEATFRRAVVSFKDKASNETAKAISKLAPEVPKADLKRIVNNAIDSHIKRLGIKPTIDVQKKKILISHTKKDTPLADIIYSMLVFNNVPPEDIIYTNCENEVCRVPENVPVYDYLKKFFVDSYSDQKMYVIFVTSEFSEKSWGALIEVGAAWITSIDSKIFNIPPGRPGHPLNDEVTWHTTERDNSTGNLSMDRVNADVFCVKLEDICNKIGYEKRTREENYSRLSGLVAIE